MCITLKLRNVTFRKMIQLGLKSKLSFTINYLFLFFDKCSSIIMDSFHLFLIFSLYTLQLNPLRKVPQWKWGLQNQSRWKRLGFSASLVCVGNLSLPERNYEFLMFPSEFLKFWYFLRDITQTVFGPWLTSVSFKIYTGYK